MPSSTAPIPVAPSQLLLVSGRAAFVVLRCPADDPSLTALLEAREPGDHPVLLAAGLDDESRARLAEETGLEVRARDWELVDAKTRAGLWDELGDLVQPRDAREAREAYDQALRLDPERRHTLHKRLDLEAADGDWTAALTTLGLLAAREDDPKARARFLYSAALIHRDHLGDPARSAQLLEAALENDRDDERAFSALELLLSDREDWRGLRRLYRDWLRAIEPGAAPAREARLWAALGELCLQRFADRDTAEMALAAAANLEPASVARRERLVEHYQQGGAVAAPKAIAEHERLLALDPGRIPSYHALCGLFAQTGERDRQFWATAALIHLGDPRDELARWAAAHRPPQFTPGSLGGTDWALLDGGGDTPLGRLLERVAPAWAAATSPRRSAAGLRRQDRVPLGSEPQVRRGRRRETSEAPSLVPQAVGYAARVLGVSPPELHFHTNHLCPLSLHTVLDDGLLTALVVRPGIEALLDDEAIVFELARQVSLSRPRWMARLLFATPAALTSAVLATLAAAGLPAPIGDGQRELVRALERDGSVTGWRDEARAFAAAVPSVDRPACEEECRRWLNAARAASDRAAFLVTGDLDAAARAIAFNTGIADGTQADAAARVLGVAAFSVGRAHSAARAALGLHDTDESGEQLWTTG